MKRLIHICTLIVGIIIFAAGWAITSSYFSIRRIEIFGLQSIRECELTLPFKHGDNLLLIRTGDVEWALTSNPRLEYVEVRKCFPDGVEISISEKQPEYLLNCGEIWGITHKGDAIPIDDMRKMPDLPIISTNEICILKPYKKVNAPSVSRALKFINEIECVDPLFLDRISEVVSRPDGEFSLFLVNTGTEVRLSGKIAESLKKLSAITQTLAAEPRRIVQIDLRFPNQGIVRFGKSRVNDDSQELNNG